MKYENQHVEHLLEEYIPLMGGEPSGIGISSSESLFSPASSLPGGGPSGITISSSSDSSVFY